MLLVLGACIPNLYSPDGVDSAAGGLACGEVLPENGWDSAAPPSTLTGTGFAEGDVLPDACMMDQSGAMVDLWQFYGTVWVLDISTMWCGPCQELASTAQEMYDGFAGEGFNYVTILPQDTLRNVPDQADLTEWADYFDLALPVLSDADGFSYNVVSNDSFPAVLVIDRDMTVVANVSPVSDAAIHLVVEDTL
jgi:peroxiredoxin